MKTLNDAWEVFEQVCLSIGVTEQERRQAQTAFYAGMISLLRMQARLGKSDPEKAMEFFKGWLEEANEYAEKKMEEVMMAEMPENKH